MSVPSVLESELVSCDRIHPNPWNPNEMTEEQMEELEVEIRTDGFGHPLDLVPCSCDVIDGEHFQIIGGEHRWTVAKKIGMPELPAYVNREWSELEQKLKTVRKNLLSGDLNSKKFTALVNSLDGRVDRSLLPKLMGFENARQFERYFLVARDAKEKSFLDGLMEDSRRERFAVDSLHDVIGSIFADCSDTLDQDYMVFSYRGASICVVLCDRSLQTSVKKMTDKLRGSGESATAFLAEAIDQCLSVEIESDTGSA